MANVDAAYGLRPVMSLDGKPYNGAAIKMYAADGSNDLFVGDPVIRTGSGDAAGVIAVSRAAANAKVYGVIVGILSDSSDDLTRDTARYVASGTNAYVLVCPAQGMLFSAQEDSVGGDLAVTNIGQNISVIFGTPSTVHPILSAAELDSSTAATTSTFPWQIHGIMPGENNALGTNAQWLVAVNALDNAGV